MAILLFVVSMTALTSCKKTSKELIVGKWECTAASFTEDGVTQPVSYLNNMIWEFTANGTVISSLNEDTNNGTATYAVVDSELTITYTDEDEIEIEKYTIKELTNSKLLLEKSIDNRIITYEFKKV